MFCWCQAKSLEVLSVELRGGRAKCPYDPDSNYTIIYVGKHISAFLSPQHTMQNILDGLRRRTADRSVSAGKVFFSNNIIRDIDIWTHDLDLKCHQCHVDQVLSNCG